MKILVLLPLIWILQTFSTTIALVEENNNSSSYKPSVAIRCGYVSLYVEQRTGKWLADLSKQETCDYDDDDDDNEEVKRYCQKAYPKLNITNIKKDTSPITFVNWCNADKDDECRIKTVFPYLCLTAEMDDGERDFEDINYDPQIVNSTAFRLAIKTFMKNIPVKTNGCNMRKYKNKEQHIVSYHRTKLANVVSKWNGVERKYNKMKSKDPVQAEAEMKRKLQLFNKELAANNKEENEAKAKLIFDTNCINDQIVKSKQDVIIQYVKTIQKKSVNAGEILQAIQWISQIFNEDRMYKLQQYEYFLNRNSSKTGNISEELFEYLKDLNKVMNESLVLLDYLPEVAAKFGFARSQFILKPIKYVPIIDDFSEIYVEDILKKFKDVSTQGERKGKVNIYEDIEYKVGIKKLPVECIVSSIRDHMKCYTRNGWRRKAQVYCNSTHGMVVRNNMGILLQCGTDSFSAVEFVCCPKEQDKDIIGNEFDNYDPQIEYPKDFYLAVKNVGTYIPPKMEDCDQTIYSRLRTQLEDVYRKKHFKLDFEYYKAEIKYQKMKNKHPVQAKAKKERALKKFNESLVALDKETNDERSTLTLEHINCIRLHVTIQKRKAMLSYLESIQKRSVNITEIHEAAQKLIEVFKIDQVFILKLSGYLGSQNSPKANKSQTFQGIKEQNKVVNEIIGLLNYLPKVAKRFGLDEYTQFMLEPMFTYSTHNYTHDVKEFLWNYSFVFGLEDQVITSEDENVEEQKVISTIGRQLDVLKVPGECKVDYIYDEMKCLTNAVWKWEIHKYCNRTHNMKRKTHEMLFSCATNRYSAVEFVCCPNRQDGDKIKFDSDFSNFDPKIVDPISFRLTVERLKSYLPVETEKCYEIGKYQLKVKKIHRDYRSSMIRVINNWKEGEKRYNRLKAKYPAYANEKLNRTYELYLETIISNEEKLKKEKSSLRLEYADCINNQTSRNKRVAFINFLGSIQKQTLIEEEILQDIRTLIQIYARDRVFVIELFEDRIFRDPSNMHKLRKELSELLKTSSKVVVESIRLLKYLPEVPQIGTAGTETNTDLDVYKSDQTRSKVEKTLQRVKQILIEEGMLKE